jgi:type IV pilus assembly protein PilA
MNKKTLVAANGFTLIELLVVIGIIAVLAAIVLIAINPGRQFQQARDAQRWSDVNAYLNAIGQNIADGKGTVCFSSVTATPTNIGTTAGNIDLTCLSPNYISTLPTDPSGGTAGDTKYKISVASGRYTIAATAETAGAPAITVTR